MRMKRLRLSALTVTVISSLVFLYIAGFLNQTSFNNLPKEVNGGVNAGRPHPSAQDEIGIAICYAADVPNGFNITIGVVKNPLFADVLITKVFINGKLPSDYLANNFAWPLQDPSVTPISIVSDAGISILSFTVIKTDDTGSPFISGATLVLTLHTYSGKNYSTSLVLP